MLTRKRAALRKANPNGDAREQSPCHKKQLAMRGSMKVPTPAHWTTVLDSGMRAVQLESFQVQELLGEGSFGEVYLATFEGQPCALKTIEIPDETDNLEWKCQEFATEVMMMQTVALISRESVCAPLAVAWEHHNGAYHLHLAMELADRGDLLDLIDEDTNWSVDGPSSAYGAERTEGVYEAYVLERASKLQLAESLAAAVAGLHAAGIVHADIKGANAGLSSCDGLLSVKLLDFGSAGQIGTDFKAFGSTGYEAPEVQERTEARPPADVYSAAATLVELWCGQWIASDTALAAREESSRSGHDPTRIRIAQLMSQIEDEDPDVAVILQRCLELDEETRPTAKELESAFRALQIGTPDDDIGEICADLRMSTISDQC